MLAVGSVVLAGLGASGAVAAEPSTASAVTGHSEWYTQAYENFPTGGYLTPQQADVAGPQRAPFGSGSHEITIGESSAQTELYRTDKYDNVLLSDLTRLEYSTLARRVSGTGDRQPTYLRLSVDTNGDGGIDDSLFFFPANNGDQHPVVNGQWQHWDVANGVINVNGDGGSTTTLADYAASHADAVLVNDPYDSIHDAGAISLITGGALGGDTDPQTNGEYFVDRVIVGKNGQDTLFDLGGSTLTNGASAHPTVDPGHAQGWQHQAYDNNVYLTSNQALVDGSAPAGGGSLRFALNDDTNPDRVELFRTTQYDGTFVRDLETLGYSTFQKADAGNSTPQQPVYLRLSVDTDGDGNKNDTLFFFPANNGAVAQSTWQSWDAANGKWNVGGDLGPASSITLEDYVVAHPDAKIVANGDADFPTQPKGGVAFLVGGGGATQMNGEYFLDNITVGKYDDATGSTYTSKAFDLEPTMPTLAVSGARVTEGNSGATLAFPVTLSRPVARPVTASFGTVNGAAKSGSDYRAKSGTVTIPAGTTTATIKIPVLSDKVREATEQLSVKLGKATNATVSDATAAGTIVNDDIRVAIALARATEHRVRANVATVSAVAGAPVKVYSVTKSGKQVLSTHLNRNGRISALLGRSYTPGTQVTVYATVQTAHGLYTSPRTKLTVRR